MNDDFCRLVGQHLTTETSKGQRRSLREAVLAVFAALCLAGLVVAATEAYGAEMLKGQSPGGVPFTLKLHNEPCSDPDVMGHLINNVQPKFVPAFKRATLRWAGQDFAACWLDYEGWVLVYDSAGDPFNPPTGVPRAAFKDDTI